MIDSNVLLDGGLKHDQYAFAVGDVAVFLPSTPSTVGVVAVGGFDMQDNPEGQTLSWRTLEAAGWRRNPKTLTKESSWLPSL